MPIHARINREDEEPTAVAARLLAAGWSTTRPRVERIVATRGPVFSLPWPTRVNLPQRLQIDFSSGTPEVTWEAAGLTMGVPRDAIDGVERVLPGFVAGSVRNAKGRVVYTPNLSVWSLTRILPVSFGFAVLAVLVLLAVFSVAVDASPQAGGRVGVSYQGPFAQRLIRPGAVVMLTRRAVWTGSPAMVAADGPGDARVENGRLIFDGELLGDAYIAGPPGSQGELDVVEGAFVVLGTNGGGPSVVDGKATEGVLLLWVWPLGSFGRR